MFILIIKEINEFMWYLCGFLGILGCVIRSVMFGNGYIGMCVSWGCR